ncbi:MAG: FixH family protein [Actinomycetota bacterium]
MLKTAAFSFGLALLAAQAIAAPNDYRFEPVQSNVAASPTATIAVRLVHVPTGKPVGDAIVFQPKVVMPMDGMAPMATAVKAGAPDGKGVYPFTADLSMAGPWTLTVSAKVQGEAATITGTVPFTATGGGHSH